MASARLLEIIDQVKALPVDWHASGSMTPAVFDAMGRLLGDLPIEHSLETGAGKTTLIFSHLSPRHTVFALNAGGTITQVKGSPLFKADAVHWIEGPTQKTLPAHRFEHKVQVALLDGPHAFPFAQLEYFYIYPLLAPGAVLMVDDIDIPTIHHMFEFLKADEMFELMEVVAKTAFFRRTSAPTFDPYGEGWWQQNYNKQKVAVDRSLLGVLERRVPGRVKRLVPPALKRGLFRLLTR